MDTSGILPTQQCTYALVPKVFKVIEETGEYYIFQKSDGKLGAVEKDKVMVVTISGFIE